MSYPMVELSELILKRNGSVNPTKFLDETFELQRMDQNVRQNLRYRLQYRPK